MRAVGADPGSRDLMTGIVTGDCKEAPDTFRQGLGLSHVRLLWKHDQFVICRNKNPCSLSMPLLWGTASCGAQIQRRSLGIYWIVPVELLIYVVHNCHGEERGSITQISFFCMIWECLTWTDKTRKIMWYGQWSEPWGQHDQSQELTGECPAEISLRGAAEPYCWAPKPYNLYSSCIATLHQFFDLAVAKNLGSFWFKGQYNLEGKGGQLLISCTPRQRLLLLSVAWSVTALTSESLILRESACMCVCLAYIVGGVLPTERLPMSSWRVTFPDYHLLLWEPTSDGGHHPVHCCLSPAEYLDIPSPLITT